jgi:hypothetical protein
MTSIGTILFAIKLYVLFYVHIIAVVKSGELYKSQSFSLCNFIYCLRHSTRFHIFHIHLNIHFFRIRD